MRKIKSFISWVGGKSVMCSTIIQLIPKPCPSYIEVFGGAAWVLFAKKPSKHLEVYNDYNSDLVNLFLCVKDRLIAFTREVGFLHINSRQEFDHFIKFLRKEIPANQFLQDEIDSAKSLFSEPELSEVLKILNEKTELYDVQRAATFYKVIRHSYGSGCKSFDNKPVNVQGMLNDLPQNSERLRNVIIENMDFETVIRRYDGPDAFFTAILHMYSLKDTTL